MINRNGDAMPNAFDPDGDQPLETTLAAQIARRQAVLGPTYRLFYRTPLHAVRAEGAFIYGADGRRYLDAYNNVACVGHAHPRVNAAIAEQMATLNTNTRYLQDGILDFAEQLLASLGGVLAHVVFTCTGSEANDLAARIAMHRTGCRGIVVTRWAYHGNSHLTAGFSPAMGDGMPLGADVRCIPAPDPRETGVDALTGHIAGNLEVAIDDLVRSGAGFAALIVDPLFSSDGIFPRPTELLGRLADVVRRREGLFIADEVQSGFGRSGERFWGFQRHDIAPDIVTMGKPMGNGYPIGAVAMSADAVAAFGRQQRYFNTFGGTAAAIAAAQTTLDVIRKERLAENALNVGDLIKSGLQVVAADHPAVSDIRGAGLYIGVELRDSQNGEPDAALADRIVNRMREDGVLISRAGANANVLKIRPPLIFDAANADELVAAFDRALAG